MDVKTVIFVITLVCKLFLGGSLVLTMVIPGFRVWPPPSRKSWQYRYAWGLTIASFLGIVVLGIVDWNSPVSTRWIQFAVGSIILVLGLAFAAWAIRVLSVTSTLGLRGKLIKRGPYRFSRNPQYLGDMLALLGYGILTGSRMAIIASVPGMLCFALAPFTEEPWLKQTYGEQYERYRQKVPRFMLFF